MSEYPWDMENMVLAQHEQPCDCAICDEIHFNRESRRLRRKSNRESLDEIQKLTIALKVAEQQRDDRWIEVGLMSEQRRNDLLYAENETLKAKIQEQNAKCNIYKCMERKDLKLHIENLQKKVAELQSQLDRIACGYWNEEQCHSIAKEALEI